ncbi:molybdopterin-binding protein [Streptomyces sp. NPDC018964]
MLLRSNLGYSLGVCGDTISACAPTGPGGRPAGSCARSRFNGTVTEVTVEDAPARVEGWAGPFRVVAPVSRESAGELGPGPGVPAVAAIKSTDVVVEGPWMCPFRTVEGVDP